MKKAIEYATEKEIRGWESHVREVNFQTAFRGEKIEEKDLLDRIIEERGKRLDSLKNGLSLNASIMNYLEIEGWKREYRMVSEDLELHLRIKATKFQGV